MERFKVKKLISGITKILLAGTLAFGTSTAVASHEEEPQSISSIEEIVTCGEKEFKVSKVEKLPGGFSATVENIETGVQELVEYRENRYDVSIIITDPDKKSYSIFFRDDFENGQVNFLRVDDLGISYKCYNNPLIDPHPSCRSKTSQENYEEWDREESEGFFEHYQKEFETYLCVMKPIREEMEYQSR